MTAARHQRKLKKERANQGARPQYERVGYLTTELPKAKADEQLWTANVKREATQSSTGSAQTARSHWKLFADDPPPISAHPIADYYSNEEYIRSPPPAHVQGPADGLRQTSFDPPRG